MADERDAAAALVERLRQGDQAALSDLFALYQERLRRMIALRLDQRLNGRVSCSDILQDSYLEALKRLPHYFEKPDMPFFVWLRLVTSQRLVDVQRQHLGAQMRDAGREVSLQGQVIPQATSVSLAAQLAGNLESPSQAPIRQEMLEQLEAAIESMDPIDREVLTLRHFEELSNDEVAKTLGLQRAAASNRYVRALKRLRETLARLGLEP
ncbi:MAG: sigma-70 family RNA polymerase sigma factor [Planctomycetota bacterium]|nr:sigma-70 family RNA polymerase sigma factor [Planctomycetota bacterium]